MLENEDAFRIWSVVQDQIIVGFNGVIGLNHSSVWSDIDEYEKEYGNVNRWSVFEKVNQLFYHFNSESKKDKNNPLAVAKTQIKK